MNHDNHIQSYFNRIAPAYKQRLNHPFFRERLQLATEGFEFQGKTILDVGAGTGVLYDYLLGKNISCEYYACDLSSRMLAKSNIPPERQFLGSVFDAGFPVSVYDYIFLLGVAYYLTEEEHFRHLQFISRHLAPGGWAIISYSNRASCYFWFWKLFRPLLSRFFSRQVAPALGIPRRGATPSILGKQIKEKGLKIEKVKYWFYQPPILERIWPALAVILGNGLERIVKGGPLMPCFAANFIIFIYKRN